MHHLGDWASHTQHLSLLQIGVYHRLVEVYYTSEKPLPGDPAIVCCLVRAIAHQEKTAVRQVLHQFFTLDPADGCWHQKRCDEELARNLQRNEMQREKVNKRWEGRKVERAIEETNAALAIHSKLKSGHILAEKLADPSRTMAHNGAPMGDTVGMPPALPNPKPYSNISKTDKTANVARVRDAAVLLSSKGFEIEETNSRLAALVGDGATEAQMVAACGVAQRAGKGTPYVLGALANMVREQSTPNMPTEPPRYPMLPRSDRGR